MEKQKPLIQKILVPVFVFLYFSGFLILCWGTVKYGHKPKRHYKKLQFKTLQASSIQPVTPISSEAVLAILPKQKLNIDWKRINSPEKVRFEDGMEELRVFTLFSTAKEEFCADEAGRIKQWKVEVLTFTDVESAVEQFNIWGNASGKVDFYGKYHFGRHEGFFIRGRQLFRVTGHCHQNGEIEAYLNQIYQLTDAKNQPEPGTFYTQLCQFPKGCNPSGKSSLSTAPKLQAQNQHTQTPKNVLVKPLDLEADFFPAYEEELDVERTFTTFYANAGTKRGGKTGITEYFLSRKANSRDVPGEAWFDGWRITFEEYESVDAASWEFDLRAKKARNNTDSFAYYGWEYYQTLSENRIITFGSSCRFTWFPNDGFHRFCRLYLPNEKTEPNTVIEAWCSGGVTVW